MYIFSYKWDSDAMHEDMVAHLNELVGTSTLVCIQDIPQASTSDVNANGGFMDRGDSGNGNYIYSAESGVMDRADWATFCLSGAPCANMAGIFGNTVVNVDVTATDTADDIASLVTLINNAGAMAVVGNFEQDFTLTGFTDVTDGDKIVAKVKDTHTATLAKYTANESYLGNMPYGLLISAA